MHRRFLSAQPRNAARLKFRERNSASAFVRRFSFWNRPFRQARSPPTDSPPGMRFARIRNRRVIFRSKKWCESQPKPAASNHHFRFVQLPLNLAMPEALTRPNQLVAGKTMAMVQAGRALGITLVASAALLQGQLTQESARCDAQRLGNAERFRAGACNSRVRRRESPPRSVGMSQVGHVRRESGARGRRACRARRIPQGVRGEALSRLTLRGRSRSGSVLRATRRWPRLLR